MHPVVFGSAARADILEAVDWYRARAPSLAERFVAEIDAAVTRMAANPQQFPVVFRDVRRARLRRFPYGLFFRIEDAGIFVLACFHGSRDPRRWAARGRTTRP